jgi:hypothetical protein
MQEFLKLCAYYHFEVIAIASGMAYVRIPEGDVIITLPQHGQRMGMLFNQVTARSRSGRYVGITGVQMTRTPEEMWKQIDACESAY